MRLCTLCFFSLLAPVCTLHADEKKVADLAQKRYDAAEKAYKAGPRDDNLPINYLLSVRLLAAHKDLKSDSEIAAYQAHYNRMSKLDARIQALALAGAARPEETAYSQLFVVEAEFWLERAKLKKTKK